MSQCPPTRIYYRAHLINLLLFLISFWLLTKLMYHHPHPPSHSSVQPFHLLPTIHGYIFKSYIVIHLSQTWLCKYVTAGTGITWKSVRYFIIHIFDILTDTVWRSTKRHGSTDSELLMMVRRRKGSTAFKNSCKTVNRTQVSFPCLVYELKPDLKCSSRK